MNGSKLLAAGLALNTALYPAKQKRTANTESSRYMSDVYMCGVQSTKRRWGQISQTQPKAF